MAVDFGANDGTTNGATPVEMVPAPGAGVKRVIKRLTIHNNDTVAADVMIQYKHATDARIVDRDTALAANASRQVRDFVLDDTDKSIEIVLGGAVTTNELDWTVYWADFS